MISRRKTILSAGPILMLIGAGAPAAAAADVAAELQAQSQNAQADIFAPRKQTDQAELLSQPVTLDLVDAPLGSALEAIARGAGLTLAYNVDIVSAGRPVTLHASALPARDAFARVLDGTRLAPNVTRSGYITLVPLSDPPTTTTDVVVDVPQQALVTGTVTDTATGEALRGAEVRVDELELSAVTDAEGRYTLEDVPPGTHTLIASMIGYGDGRRQTTVTGGATATVDFALKVSALPLDEMVVTGTMVPTRRRAVPSPISVISASDIEGMGAVRFEDVLRSMPGIGVVTRGGGEEHSSYLFIRGASSFDALAQTVKTYIDGVEVTNAVYALNQIDPASIDRVELIRGPQASTLHGSEAVAGVLQIFTKKGHDSAGRIQMQATSAFGGLQSQYNAGAALLQDHTVTIEAGNPNLSYRLGASYKSNGEWVEDELIDELGWDISNSALRDIGVAGGARYVNGPLRAEISARLHDKSGGVPLPKALTDPVRNGSWSFPTYSKPSGRERQLQFHTYGLSVAYDAGSRWKHRLTIGRDGTQIEFMQPEPRLTAPSDTFLSYQLIDWVKQSLTYNTAVDVLSGSLSSTMQAGFDLSEFSQRQITAQQARQLVGDLGNAPFTRSSVTNHGLFFQTQTAWNDELFFTAGLRADRSTALGEDAGYVWSPRAGLSHVLGIGSIAIKSRVAYGKAIRPPDPSQKFGRLTGSSIYRENLGLMAEKQSGYDLGVDLQAGSWLALGATYYNQLAEDLVTAVRLNDPAASPAVFQYQNVGRIRNSGWELEGDAQFSPFQIRAHYSLMESSVEWLSEEYTGTDFVVGDRPLGVPESTGGLRTTYSDGSLTLTIGMSYKGPWQEQRYLPYLEAVLGTDPNREPYTGSLRDYIDEYPAVYRYELNVTYDISRDAGVSLMIDNLLNDDSPDQWDYHLVRGRQFLVGVRLGSGR